MKKVITINSACMYEMYNNDINFIFKNILV